MSSTNAMTAHALMEIATMASRRFRSDHSGNRCGTIRQDHRNSALTIIPAGTT
jgi:hypothetical protein